MTKVLTFEVRINGLEDKIWRKIEITDLRTVAELAYTILASFDSLAYHLYYIKSKDIIYYCHNELDEANDKSLYVDATITKLSNISLTDNDTMEMVYDFGSPTTFKIKYLGARDLERGHGTHYPYVIDGAGRGMIDDISDYDLKDIVDDIDKKGYSNFNFTPGYQRPIKYDYRQYDIESDNILLKGEVLEIKEGYENIP